MKEILLATSNLHKIREFREMFRPLHNFELISLCQHPEYIPPEETGSSFKENAILKAIHAAQFFGALVIADDSGLVVPSLKGLPGVHSRRYAGPSATDVENRQKLLQAMISFQGVERTAYYECVIAIADAKGLRKCVEGTCEGVVVTESRGRSGFGYDPLFVKTDYDKTFAELEASVKNRISHRRKAFDRMMTFLESYRE